MKWKFWQKKKPVWQWLLERKSEQAQESVIRRFEIPSGEVQWIRQLFDDYQSIPGGADKEAHQFSPRNPAVQGGEVRSRPLGR